MASWIAVLLVTALLAASPRDCFAEDTPQATPDHPADLLTREQWQQRVETARRRSEGFLANARTQAQSSPPPEPLQTEASERVVNDPTLRPGDIVATDRGFFVFVGRDEEHQSADFVPVPKRHIPR
jgi:hypothetical protein